MPHVTWPVALAPLALLAHWLRARFPTVPPWALAVGAVVASAVAGAVGARALAWLARLALIAAGVGVAVFVMRGVA